MAFIHMNRRRGKRGQQHRVEDGQVRLSRRDEGSIAWIGKVQEQYIQQLKGCRSMSCIDKGKEHVPIELMM